MHKNTIPFLFVLLIFLSACQSRRDRTQDIATIDTKISELAEAQEIYKNIDLEEAEEISSTIMEQIKYIQKNYTDTMSKADALLLTNYKNAAKRVKNNKQTKMYIDKELLRAHIQLTNLKSAMIEGATEDKNGKVIDDQYLDHALKEELGYTNQLIQQIGFLKDNCQVAKEQYLDMKPKVGAIIVTLQQKAKHQ